MTDGFESLVRRATGHEPFPYQKRLAREGLPELLDVPTGCGKTLAAVLPWLYRRRFHPDPSVRASTPHWLVFALPMRTLVEQTYEVVRGWLENLELCDEIGLSRVMGGEPRTDARWRTDPDRDAVFVGTIDMLLSRALNRGYAESRFVWPIDFGLFNNGCQWVFDEVQLMGAALPTSRQLEGLRHRLGCAVPSRSMWMSATVDERALRTIDRPDVDTTVELGLPDLAHPEVAIRCNATKTVRAVEASGRGYEAMLAAVLAEVHQRGTLTLAVCNVVERARNLYARLLKQVGGDTELVLLHSRFRPPDRSRLAAAALADVDPTGPGRIVVATQVVEAGIDISARVLLTEAAPWPSIVQRAGRCNRDGRTRDAQLLWVEPPKPSPYHADDVAAAAAALRQLQDTVISPASLRDIDVPVKSVTHPVLRRSDLLGLFDTMPDLSGNDLDVSPFIRAADELDVHVAWREERPRGPGHMPTRDELCPVPISEVRKLLRDPARVAWTFDHFAAEWIAADSTAIRPGHTVVLDARAGGYEPSMGWDPTSRRSVPSVDQMDPSELAVGDDAIAADPITFTRRRWVGLCEHLADVERDAAELGERLGANGLSSAMLEATVVAGRLHDIGKAHECFQDTLLRSCDDDERTDRARGVPWAKSGSSRRPLHSRRYFRHELASLLMLLGTGEAVLDGVEEVDLVRYLVASHHGRVRMSIRSLPDEEHHPSGGRVALGVFDGDEIQAVTIPGGTVPACRLDLAPMEIGETNGSRSWAERALALRDRPDLGPFRLAFLEAIVRLADWRVSSSYDRSD